MTDKYDRSNTMTVNGKLYIRKTHPDDIKGYAKLWEEVLMNAWSSARGCRSAYKENAEMVKNSSLRWIKNMGCIDDGRYINTFKLACYINGYDPEVVRDGMIKAIQSNRKFRLNRVGRKRGLKTK